MKKIYIVTAFLILSISCKPSQKFLKKQTQLTARQIQYVNVLILTTKKRITIGTSGRLKIKSKMSQKILYDSVNKKLVFYPDRIKEVLQVESWKTPLLLNNKPYRGSFELHNVMGKIYVINIITLEKYLYSVVPSEIPSTWPKEALKAQAVAARTYTLYHLLHNKKKRIYDLDATTNFQVYKGVAAETKQTTQAVIDTTAEIIQYNHQPILAYFHSTCGGKIIDDKFVWEHSDKPYLRSKVCNFCRNSPYYNWEADIDLYAIRQSLSKKHSGIGKITRIQFKKRGGRVHSVIIHHTNGIVKLTGNNFRLLFPPKTLKSMFFKSRKKGNGLKIIGHGWGHGVGMCQFGAKGQAEIGRNYRSILKYYYFNCVIRKYRYHRNH